MLATYSNPLERFATKWLARKVFAAARERKAREGDLPWTLARGDRVTLIKGGRFQDRKSGKRIPYVAGECGAVIWIGAWGKPLRGGWRPNNPDVVKVGIALDSRDGVDGERGPVIFASLLRVRREGPGKSLRTLARDSIEAARNGTIVRAVAELIKVN